MILCDVNVLVYAFREDMKEHHAYHEWLVDRLGDDETLALSGLVASGFVRVVTNRRVFRRPSPLDLALRFVAEIRAVPGVMAISEGSRHWGIFERLCTTVGARGNLVPDAYIAALAIESGCELISSDRGFARFPQLRWRHPLD